MATKHMAQINIAQRLRQLAWLLGLVLIGIFISVSSPAQTRYNKKKEQHFKARYRQQPTHAPGACAVLMKKRSETRNIRVTARATRKARVKPMAEVDPPGFARNELGGPVVVAASANP
jgi:hypothetical protein